MLQNLARWLLPALVVLSLLAIWSRWRGGGPEGETLIGMVRRLTSPAAAETGMHEPTDTMAAEAEPPATGFIAAAEAGGFSDRRAASEFEEPAEADAEGFAAVERPVSNYSYRPPVPPAFEPEEPERFASRAEAESLPSAVPPTLSRRAQSFLPSRQTSPPPAPQLKRVASFNAMCPYCGFATRLGEHMKGEKFRCRRCQRFVAGRSAFAAYAQRAGW